MMRAILTYTILFLQLLNAATTISGVSDFTILDSDTVISSNDGTSLSYNNQYVGTTQSGSDQGSGVTQNTSASFTPTAAVPLYFQFSTVVANKETDFFYGAAVTDVASANAKRSDQNAFSVGISTTGDIFARQNGNNLLSFTTLAGLTQGSIVDFDIVVYTDGAHKFSYDVTASSGGVSETMTGVSGNQNAQTNVSNYDFHAIGTRGLATGDYLLSDYTVSDMPIPEPSSLLLLVTGGLFLLRRHRS